jgi:hypothetical protein
MPQADFARRPPQPKSYKFQERDGLILEAIQAYEGMLSEEQVKRLFFNPDTGLRQAQRRLEFLWRDGYVKRPNWRKRAAIGQTVYFLDEKGAEYVAGLEGKSLAGFKWRKQPRWSLVGHDLALNDFRIAVEEAVANTPELTLEDDWIASSEFWSHPDAVEYRDLNGRKQKRQVRPDGYFWVSLALGGRVFDYRFLVEVDLRTEDNPRIGREKILPGLAYIQSQAFERRFGKKSGQFLFVTTSERRALSMKRQTERVAEQNARLFYFTWFDQVNPQTVFDHIWYRGGEEHFVSPLS